MAEDKKKKNKAINKEKKTEEQKKKSVLDTVKETLHKWFDSIRERIKSVLESLGKTQKTEQAPEENDAAEDKQGTEPDKETGGEAENNQDEAEKTAELKPCQFVPLKNEKESEDAETEKALEKADIFLSSRKTAFALIVTIVTLLMTAYFYLYRKGQLDYYHVDDIWNTFADKGIFYKFLIPIGFASIILFALLMPVLPVLLSVPLIKNDLKKVLRNEIPSKKEKKDTVLGIIVCLSIIIGLGLWWFVEITLNWLRKEPDNSPVWRTLLIIIFLVPILFGIRETIKNISGKELMRKRTIIIDTALTIPWIGFLGYIVYFVGGVEAEYKRVYSFICFTEEIQSPPTEQIQALNILCPVTTTATTSTTASGTTTTDTTTTTTTTAPADMPDDVPVYVILAENKDNYLAAAGMVRQGGRLDLDRDCQIILEKKNQIVLKKTFTEVNVDYIFDYIFEKEEEQP